ncbi:hypothetical protein HYV91_01025 [Candidatus Wolfebacteria bacterium]|nr:hypothetical protein [Candidatus Wolfebacteria bacterium]
MNIFNNLDLLSVGLAVAGVGILGFIVFFNNRRSITNITFLIFSIITVFWSVVNYLYYQISAIETSFWILRFVIFLGVWHAFSFFQMCYVFPKEKVGFPRWYKFILLPFIVITAVLTFTPLVFNQVAEVSSGGGIEKIVNGPGIFVFAVAVLTMVIGGVSILVRKTVKAKDIERAQFRYVTLGTFITFVLLMIFNFILPAFFDNPRFIPLGAVFIFPFIAFTAYAIFKHHLLHIKIIATEILTFILAVVSFVEVVLAREPNVVIFRSLVFALILIFGILLIRSVRREVEQREKLEILTKELEAANEKLKDLDKLKSEFLSFASHQIKSPMAVVKGFASLIYDGSYGPVSDKIKETVGRIKESVDRLLALVNNFLDLRKIEGGKMEYNFELADVVGLVKKIVDDFKILAGDKHLKLTLEAPPGEIKTKIDVQRLSQVIQNLIDNGIKYTEKGFVRVSLTKQLTTNNQQREVLITVSDSGRGMSAELIPKLFEQFSRDDSVRKLKQGTGLGLFIAKQIVSGHNGQIWAESAGEGKGSKFFVKLPIVSM